MGDKWKVGGPLVPDLDTALANYPHTVVRLEGSARSNIFTFLQQHPIDILVVGDHWPQSVMQLVSCAFHACTRSPAKCRQVPVVAAAAARRRPMRWRRTAADARAMGRG